MTPSPNILDDRGRFAMVVEKFNHGFPFFVYAGFSVGLLLFVILVVPETKGRTLEEIEGEALGGEGSR